MPAEEYGSSPQLAMLTPSSDIGAVLSGKDAGERWYVANSRMRAENRAVDRFERQDPGVFRLRYRKAVRHTREARSVPDPLFLNYVRLDASRGLWRAVKGTRDVVRLIMLGETPAPLPHVFVEDLGAKTNAGGVINRTWIFKIDQAARIADGPFAALIGKREHPGAAGRVLLSLLGQKVFAASRCEALMAVV